MQIIRWLFLALAACGIPADEEPDDFGPGGKADGVDASKLTEGTPPAVGLLRFVNASSTTLVRLREAGVTSATAKKLIAHRDAPDPFDDVAELDAISGVGPSTLQKLLDFAFAQGFVPEGADVLGTYDGVTFTVDQAGAVVRVVNTASSAQLDVDADLDGPAVTAIVDARPIGSVLALSQLASVGQVTLEKLRAHATAAREIGVISDLDSTIIPPAPSGQELPDAPYAGIAELMQILEHGGGSGAAGDFNFVTARQPSGVIGVPDWLALHGVPAGPISTGISGIPGVAKAEKVRDITKIIDGNPGQAYVMFGDTNHVDPDAYRTILASFPDRVTIAFMHDVKTIDPTRLVGLFVVKNYAQSAAELFRRKLISEAQARSVMEAVVAGGEITQPELEALIAANQPN